MKLLLSALLALLSTQAFAQSSNFAGGGPQSLPDTAAVTTLNVSGTSTLGTTNVAGTLTASGGGGAAVAYNVNAGSITTGNLAINQGSGIFTGTTASTMSPAGLLYYIDRFQITGATFTAGSTLTNFSTYTYTANDVVKPGDTIVIECRFQNQGTLTSPSYGIYSSQAAGDISYGVITTAGNTFIIRLFLTLQSNNKFMANPSGEQISTSQGLGFITVTDNGYPDGAGGPAFPTNVNQTFHCDGKVSSGGTVNFMWMKVSKR